VRSPADQVTIAPASAVSRAGGSSRSTVMAV
jgi:hypothetical protein